LFTDAFEHFLDGGGVTKEGNCHFQTFRRNVANGRFDVVGDPFNEIWWVLVLNVQHLLVNFLGGHATTEECGGSKVTSVSGVGSAHHVLSVEHLLGELGDGESTILLRTTGGKRSETSHEEMETWEGDQVDGELSQVRVELTWESEAASDTWDGGRDEMVEITVCWGGELEGSEANIIKSFVINAHNFIGVFDELMDWEGSIIRLNDCVRHLGGWHDWEWSHDSIGVLFTDLGDQKGSHTGAGTTTEGVGDLETLEAITTFSFFSNDVEDGVNELSTFSVMTFGPVVTSTSLTEDEVVGSEELTERSSTDGVHGSWLEIHEDSTWDISATGGFVVIDVDSLELEIRVTMISTSGVDTVFVRDNLPKFGTDLVTTLTSLNVYNLTHLL
jgi:hypothetical protein